MMVSYPHNKEETIKNYKISLLKEKAQYKPQKWIKVKHYNNNNKLTTQTSQEWTWSSGIKH